MTSKEKLDVKVLRMTARGDIGYGDTKYHLKLLAAAADALEFPGDGHCNECGSFVGNGAPHAWKCPYGAADEPKALTVAACEYLQSYMFETHGLKYSLEQARLVLHAALTGHDAGKRDAVPPPDALLAANAKLIGVLRRIRTHWMERQNKALFIDGRDVAHIIDECELSDSRSASSGASSAAAGASLAGRLSDEKKEPTAEGALRELRERLGLPGETSADASPYNCGPTAIRFKR